MKITHWAVLALLPLAACSHNPPPMPVAAMPMPSAQDQTFAMMAAQSDMFEVQSSQMALKKTHNRRIRAFAQRMIDDHGKTTQQLTALAAEKSMTLPTSLGVDMQEKMNTLQVAGRTFDREYMAAQVSGHAKAVENLQTEIDGGTDPDLKMFAQNTLPAVQDHVKMAQPISMR